ncbi:cobalamin B12-binding domain-containing protein [Streptomyces sp. NPDC096033]|uniref:cobalamin B12-binding domain-containing protein n=1 Tax=Streptomyces sp. NPDC096033 TaxID=3366071 RepID=UPI003803E4F8
MSRTTPVAPSPAHTHTPARTGRRILVSSVSSDSHTWNLVFLQLLLEEMGHEVFNAGACVPDELVVSECRRLRPDALVVSTVNGHGALDGRRLIARLRQEPDLRDLQVVIGGKLGVRGAEAGTHAPALMAAGFDAVFEDAAGTEEFRRYLGEAAPARAVAPAPGRGPAPAGAR